MSRNKNQALLKIVFEWAIAILLIVFGAIGVMSYILLYSLELQERLIFGGDQLLDGLLFYGWFALYSAGLFLLSNLTIKYA